MATSAPLLRRDRTGWSDTNVHSVTEESLDGLYDKLQRKTQNQFGGLAIGPGWLKYEYNDSIWNLDDGRLSAIAYHTATGS